MWEHRNEQGFSGCIYWDSYMQTRGAVIFGVAAASSFLGSMFVIVAFVNMLKATHEALGNIADLDADDADTDMSSLPHTPTPSSQVGGLPSGELSLQQRELRRRYVR